MSTQYHKPLEFSHKLSSKTNSKIAQSAVKNTIWMIYDANESTQQKIKTNIKKGKIIFLYT